MSSRKQKDAMPNAAAPADSLELSLPDLDLPGIGDLPTFGEEPDDAERPMEDVLGEIGQGFKARREAEKRRFEQATDSEFWCCLCFQSREQKDAFLKALRWDQFGDKYIDGEAVASALGLTLPSEADRRFVTEKADPKLSELSLPL